MKAINNLEELDELLKELKQATPPIILRSEYWKGWNDAFNLIKRKLE